MKVNEHDQKEWFSLWLGGPSLACIEAICSDGKTRKTYIQGEPDTFFSQPAAIKVKGKTVSGYITYDDGLCQFRANKGGKNGYLLP